MFLPEALHAAPPGSSGPPGDPRAATRSPAVPPQLGALAGEAVFGAGVLCGTGYERVRLAELSGCGLGASGTGTEVARCRGRGWCCCPPAPVAGRAGEVQLAAAAPRGPGWLEAAAAVGARCASRPAWGALQRRACWRGWRRRVATACVLEVCPGAVFNFGALWGCSL